MRASTVIGSAAAVVATAAVGGFASRPAQSGWYTRLSKPPFQPPAAAFPIAWTSLYTDIAVTSAATIDRLDDAGRHSEALAYRRALAANLVLNASWTWIFFNHHRLGTAAVVAGVLTASSADLTRRAAAARPRGGWALLPYPLWCGFATVLSTDIWRRNR